ncbi:hypothetical protein M431DRAFT_443708 [Trichoderma harzianum CBS 226.95]|uniref:Uncharacterized protein n=1 Tax=Trichoderma harzianum CBS 226.95 TaxID=983964 RepID=A0A2T4A9H3_TRIHA|nr:hypothetical protein M431DRAFT_443708 [Trichoderma harzianum CBS 226.95]PTB53744.1 hypothetical protein M431DRAFT_443708 [Trichoderma harzianum CBS 226.95]
MLWTSNFTMAFFNFEIAALHSTIQLCGNANMEKREKCCSLHWNCRVMDSLLWTNGKSCIVKGGGGGRTRPLQEIRPFHNAVVCSPEAVELITSTKHSIHPSTWHTIDAS